ncbi:MAG: methylated-DNA--[protein]-cysteine S-methyltransferase [bacterium]|nr:methylated-DNA--[protein]-cysteine S-methyltransferase [bacterium]
MKTATLNQPSAVELNGHSHPKVSDTEIVCGSIPSPIGTLSAVVTKRGLLALAFPNDPASTLDRVSRLIGADITEKPAEVAEIQTWLDSFFEGGPSTPLRLDRSLITPFQDRVLGAASAIPMGETRTYGEVATLVGNPRAARAVGRALGTNPIPIVLPCHRVTAADGSLHGYAGGLGIKTWLLDHERSLSNR